MSDYLETTVDKFTFKVATGRFYTSEGVWAKLEDRHIRIGLSDFVQQRSGDVAFADVRPAGAVLAAGDELAVIETIKVNITYSSPVNGKIVEVNQAMNDAPEAINQDPYGAGWLATRREGKFVFYRLETPGVIESVQLAGRLEGLAPSAMVLGARTRRGSCGCPTCAVPLEAQ